MADLHHTAANSVRLPRRLAGLSAALLLATTVLPAQALAEAAAEPAPTEPSILVIGTRYVSGIQPERELDEKAISGYDASTVDELLAEVQSELGADRSPPLILVNGERVSSLDDIGAFPVEAIENVKILPHGSAVGVGGKSSQRVISLTLKKKVRSAILLAAHNLATDGDWNADRGEAILTYVEGAKRVNVSFRVRDEDDLFEYERGIVQPAATPGLGHFRTLRPDSRTYELNGTFATRLAPWLTANARLRFAHATGRSARGLPSTLFVLPSTHPDSPFATDVEFELFGPDALHSRTQRDGGEGSLTLNGTFGSWTSQFNASHS